MAKCKEIRVLLCKEYQDIIKKKKKQSKTFLSKPRAIRAIMREWDEEQIKKSK